jgi:LacI family transcriptional regulator
MLKDRGVPMVFVDRVGDDRDVWSVVVDDREGGRLAARHLVNRGHRRIAFLGHPHRSPKVKLRYQGARDVVDQSAGDITLELVSASSWTVEEGRRVGALLAARQEDKRPTAVFCANDMLAMGLTQELLRAGLDVPGDIAVIGYDDIEWAPLGAVPLTTIAQPREVLGRTAVEMMIRLIDRSEPLPEANHIVLKPELVVRESA